MIRVGHGYDVHRLKEGRKLILGGVEIEHEKGLDGHSDADVCIHALIDAMLGAAAMGDIGQYFPDTDEQYEGISSIELLEKTVFMVEDLGYSLGNADITIIAQAPKLAPYIDTMRENIAAACGADINDINVKATTTEGLGFEGEKSGISAHAVVLLYQIESYPLSED